jgi:LysM repeat protein
MGYWGWRPLICAIFISVWVASCSVVSESAPTISPTYRPQITLTVRFRGPPAATVAPEFPITTTPKPVPDGDAYLLYTVRPGDTLLGIALDFGVTVEQIHAANGQIDPRNLQVGQQINIPQGLSLTPATAAPLPLELARPACYETPTDSILCLGTVYNNREYPIWRVHVRIKLLRSDGGILAEHDAGVEQGIIPPGQAAPYSALFKADWHDYGFAAVSLQTADATPQNIERFVPLIVEAETPSLIDGRYIVSATLYNPSPFPTGPVRLFLTLLDDEGQVVGYRAAGTGNGLAPNTRQAIRIEALPQISTLALTHTLYAEASRLG